jgi:alkaline phosphatase
LGRRSLAAPIASVIKAGENAATSNAPVRMSMPPSHKLIAALPALLLAACANAPTSPSQPAAESAPNTAIEVPAVARPQGETAGWWFLSGAAAASERGASRGRARNLVLFIGDGMGMTTVAAARILEGQRNGAPGEEHRLAFEDFPHTAFARTYNTDRQTPDSAGTMTAMSSGVKTRMGMLAVGPSVLRGDCGATAGDELVSLLEIAQLAGLSTGIVTTTRITHATPAATYARTPERNWEDDVTLGPLAAAAGCKDIAQQLVEPRLGQGPDVAFGGGRDRFLPREAGGARGDRRDLIDEWRTRTGGRYVADAAALGKLDPTDRVPWLGLFARDHLQFEHDRTRIASPEPSLADLTRAAIARLARDPDGFVLVVEGGRIDHAHHYGNAHRALTDTIALSDAVRVALQQVDLDDTLVVVTADHSHVLTFAGYPVRGNPILGLVRGVSGEDAPDGPYAVDSLGLPYTTLSYANGPGYTGASNRQPEGAKRHRHEFSEMTPIRAGRPDLRAVEPTDPDFMQEATVPLQDETHGGEDVPVYATGAGSAAFRGSLEQHVLFHLMLQSTPMLREHLCSAGLCDALGIPVRVPRPAALEARESSSKPE